MSSNTSGHWDGKNYVLANPPKKKRRGLKIAAGTVAGLLLVGGCGAALSGGEEAPTEPETSSPTAEVPQTPSEAPTAPEPEVYDPPAPLPELDETEPWGGLFTEEELAENFLDVVRAEPSSPAIRATDDATLLEWGRSVCPAVEAGATFYTITFPGLDPYLEAPLVAGAAVGTWCPELMEEAVGEGTY